jgi:hypothetical protein
VDWLIPIFFFITIIACGGMLLGYVEGRRKFKLELHKEDRRLVEARTRELEAQNKRVELEYSKALLELERFDRRAPDARAARLPAATPQVSDSSTGPR